MNRAIILDCRYRMSLPVVRSLGVMDVPVYGADLIGTPREKSLGFYSKYIEDTYSLPAPDDEEFIPKLKTICGDDFPVLLPCGINSLLKIAECKAEVAKFAKIAVPDFDKISLANDKAALMKFASEIGIPTPFTTTLGDESVEELAGRITYPVVIKFREGELLGLDPSERYKIIRTKDAFIKEFNRMHALQEFPLVQQYIEGEGFGVSAVFDKNHKPIQVFCHKRLREYPISGGPSSLCVSIWDEKKVEYAVKLLEALSWEGVAMVEFKGDYLMEINPRFWGSLALAPISGCNIPYALYRAAIGECGGEISCNYKVGRKMQFFLQDSLSVLSWVKKGKIGVFFKYILDLLNPNVKDGVFKLNDFKASIQYFKQAIKKRDKIR